MNINVLIVSNLIIFSNISQQMSSESTGGKIARGGATAGITMTNILANLVYAGMRAQGSDKRFARTAAFFIGFPGTLLTYFVVDEGSERAYGVDLPRRRNND